VPLLVETMHQGRSTDVDSSLEAARDRCRRLVAELPQAVRTVGEETPYQVDPSAAVAAAIPDERTG
jgi:hypothetical protein